MSKNVAILSDTGKVLAINVYLDDYELASNQVLVIGPAYVGGTYNFDANVFIAPQPYDSWTLDENFNWQPPTPMPSTGGPYRWSEEDLEWVAI